MKKRIKERKEKEKEKEEEDEQTLDPFTDIYTYTGLCLAHPLDIVNIF